MNEELTDREQEVLLLVCRGLDEKQIARRLQIKINTIRTFMNRLYQKFYISERYGCSVKSVQRLRLVLTYLKDHRELLDKIGWEENEG